jgi:hypothetical protein
LSVARRPRSSRAGDRRGDGRRGVRGDSLRFAPLRRLLRRVGFRSGRASTWLPLLEGKFADAHPTISAAWIRHRIHSVARSRTTPLHRERLGHLAGGTDVLFAAQEEAHADVRPARTVQQTELPQLSRVARVPSADEVVVTFDPDIPEGNGTGEAPSSGAASNNVTWCRALRSWARAKLVGPPPMMPTLAMELADPRFRYSPRNASALSWSRRRRVCASRPEGSSAAIGSSVPRRKG